MLGPKFISLLYNCDGMTVATTDISMNKFGQIDVVSGADKCDQDVQTVMLLPKQPDNELLAHGGSNIPYLLGSSVPPDVLPMMLEVEVLKTLELLSLKQTSYELPPEEVIDIDANEMFVEVGYKAGTGDKTQYGIVIHYTTLGKEHRDNPVVF